MSENSIESVINLITTDKDATEQLISLTKSITGQETSNVSKQQPETTDKMQLKINLINAIIPLLSEKAAEQAHFLVKLLSIVTILNQIKNNNN